MIHRNIEHPDRYRPWLFSATVLVFALSSMFGISGCRKPKPPSSYGNGRSQQVTPQTEEHFTRSLELIQRIDESNTRDSANNLVYHLSSWIETQDPDPEWIADRLLSQLPAFWRNYVSSTQKMSEQSFHVDDVKFLQESIWMRDISQSVSQLPHNREFFQLIEQAGLSKVESQRNAMTTALQRLHSQLGKSDAENLAKAVRLFDWTIRNVQLEPLLPSPENATKKENLGPPATRGIPGPGYQRHPWQSMLYGQGDAWQRARVFILLARQQKIDAVMLAVGEEDSSQPRPWLPAVVINDRLYLFDTALGFPIPGPQGKGIATLQQVVAEPTLLRALDVEKQDADAGFQYPVDAGDLKNIVALIDASPATLSHRMKILQSRLTGENKIVLTTVPSQTVKAVQKGGHVKSVQLWTLPLQAMLYYNVRIDRISRLDFSKEEDRQTYDEFSLREGIFLTLGPLVKGRQQLFHGEVNNRVDQVTKAKMIGAKFWYMKSRNSDDLIEQLKTNDQLRYEMGFTQALPEDRKERESVLEKFAVREVRIRVTAGYWLGLTQADQGNDAASAKWFQRTLDESDKFWQHGARYNLARAWEAMGQTDKAREIYLNDQSPQRHGNLLRARWLKDTPSPATTDETK